MCHRPQFEPDHEEHHDHAELRDVHYILAFGLYQSEAERADHDSREQISQDRPEPEPLRQRHGNDGRQQIDERLGKSHEASPWLSIARGETTQAIPFVFSAPQIIGDWKGRPLLRSRYGGEWSEREKGHRRVRAELP
jgi:hypothetical protein